MTEMSLEEAKSRLSEIIDRALAGEMIVLTRDGTPVAYLTPIAPASSMAAVRGSLAGQIKFAGDLDEMPDGFSEALGD